MGETLFSSVTPAKAGVQGNQRVLAPLVPGFRRDDDEGAATNRPYAIALQELRSTDA
jgi:hypothetical protein